MRDADKSIAQLSEEASRYKRIGLLWSKIAIVLALISLALNVYRLWSALS